MKVLKTFNYKKLITAQVEQEEMPLIDDEINVQDEPQQNNIFDKQNEEQLISPEEDILVLDENEIEKNLVDNYPEDEVTTEALQNAEQLDEEQEIPLPSVEEATDGIPEFNNAMDAIRFAMDNNKVVKVNYTTVKGGNINRVIEPFHIFQAKTTGNVIVVSYDRSVAGGTTLKHEKIKGVSRSRASAIRNFIIDHINSYIFTGKKFKTKFKVSQNKGKISMNTNIFNQLNNIGNELEQKGLTKSAEIITDVMKNLIQIKESQYVGSQGYWIRNSRCWGNCYRHKRTSNPKMAAQEVFNECWKEYLDAIETDGTATWDKYAQRSYDRDFGGINTDDYDPMSESDEMSDGGYGELGGNGFGTDDPAENIDINTELMEKMQTYSNLIQSGQGNSTEAQALQSELISLGLISDPNDKMDFSDSSKYDELKEFSSSKDEIRTASANFIKTVKASVKSGLSLPEAICAKINDELEKPITKIITNADTLISLAEVLSENGHKELGQKVADISLDIMKEADFGRGTTKGKGFFGGAWNLVQRGWDKLRGRSEGGKKELDLVVMHLRGMLNRIHAILQKIQFGNKGAKSYNAMKQAQAAPQPAPQATAKVPGLKGQLSNDFAQFMKDLGQEVAFLSGLAMKNKDDDIQQIAQTINSSLVEAQGIWRKNQGAGFNAQEVTDFLIKLRTEVMEVMTNALSNKSATQPSATQPAGTQPAGTQPAGTQPAGTQPAGTPGRMIDLNNIAASDISGLNAAELKALRKLVADAIAKLVTKPKTKNP